jgi:glycosyltransferase involved in cell wall biosynthesis
MPKPSFHLAVCIPTYRRPHLLQMLLGDLDLQTVAIDRLIVVDGDPSSGSVLKTLERQPCVASEVLYVASNHANLPFQRYLGWRAAHGAALLLYLDDDLRLLSAAGIETLIRPLRALRGRVVGTTAEFVAPPGEAQGSRRSPRGPGNHIPWRRLLGRLGSSHRIPTGGVSPAGHRRPVAFRGKPYEIVGGLRGGAMAYRMSAITEDCFSDALFAMGEHGWGLGEDTLLSRNIGSRGILLTAQRAGIVHPHGHEPVACRSDAFGRGYATAYSRRLLNDHFRGSEPPRWSDRLALIKSYAANVAMNWIGAAGRRRDHGAAAFAAGYSFGAMRGLLQAPSSRHLTPGIDWFADAEAALAETRELSPIPA